MSPLTTADHAVLFGPVVAAEKPGNRTLSPGFLCGTQLSICDSLHTVYDRSQIKIWRRPRFGDRRLLRAGTDVLDFVAVLAGEPHVRDATALGVADLLAVLRRRRRHLGGDPPPAQRRRDPVAVGP